MTKRPKVFGIGFHKTGTSSLAAALKQLGYRVTGPNAIANPNIGRDVYKIADKLVDEYDAFQDNPWPLIYKELDAKHPASKFILTVRPAEPWIQSMTRHFGAKTTPMREWIYGVGYPKGNEELYISRYERHNAEVMEYFKERPQDLLVLRLTEGEGWEKLCRFLNKQIPDVEFPHTNQAGTRKSTPPLKRLYGRLRQKLDLQSK